MMNIANRIFYASLSYLHTSCQRKICVRSRAGSHATISGDVTSGNDMTCLIRSSYTHLGTEAIFDIDSLPSLDSRRGVRG